MIDITRRVRLAQPGMSGVHRQLAFVGVMAQFLTVTGLAAQFDSLATDADVTALVQDWQSPSGDIAALTTGSIRTRDGRVFDIVVTTATDDAQTDAIRLAALEVLITYFDSLLGVSQQRLVSAPVGARLGGGSNLGPFRMGNVPLPSDRREQVALVMRDLAVGGGAIAIRNAARFLRQALAYHAPEVTPIDVAALSLDYSCGNEFIVLNGSDLALPLGLEFTMTGRRDTVLVDSLGTPFQAVPEHGGSVRLLLGEQEVANVQLGQFPCYKGMVATGRPMFGGSTDDPTFVASSNQQILVGSVVTPNPCYVVEGGFAVVSGIWTVTVTATESIQPGQFCEQSFTAFDYKGQLTGMPPGQHAVNVVHEVDGTVTETFTVTADVPL